jgi:hypothetical protein
MPVFIAVYPSSCCVYTGTMNTVAKSAKPRTKVRLAHMASLRLLQDAQVDDGMVRHESPSRRKATRETTATDRQDDDVALGEPVLGLAALEHRLEGPEARDEEPDPDPVDGVGTLRACSGSLMRVPREDRGAEPDREVDVEDPGPGVVVDDPAADRRARWSARRRGRPRRARRRSRAAPPCTSRRGSPGRSTGGRRRRSPG